MRELLRFFGAFGKVALLFIALVPAVFEFAEAKEERCPRWASSDAQMLENTYQYRLKGSDQPVGIGPKLSAPSYHWLRGVWFRMPFGYQNPWPPFALHESAVDLDQYISSLSHTSATGYDPSTGEYNPNLVKGRILQPSFSFWMPCLRYVERDLGEAVAFRPCEAGREPPSADEYVVTFQIRWPFLEGSRDSEHARRFRNEEERIRTTGRALFQDSSWEEHSLNGPISGTKNYHIYSDTDDLAVKLRCTPYRGENAPPNPGCNGWVWDKKKNLILYVRFPADRGQDGLEEHWPAPVNAAIKMVESWKLEGRPGAED